MKRIPVAVVAGPTASGKTKLAVSLCKALDGEVISADSMQIYQGMQIASAKPTLEEMDGVPHHLLDFQPLGKPFSVADYVELAGKTVQNIHDARELPVIAGGTGLYIRSLLQGIDFAPQNADPAVRAELEAAEQREGIEPLYEELGRVDPQAAQAIHPNNKKRVIRALEMYRTTGRTMAENAALSRRKESPYEACFLCLAFRDRQKLYDRINQRVDSMLEAGLVQEAKEVFASCGPTAVQAIGYKELQPYFRGTCSLEAAAESIKRETRRYAKRQLTWFRREETAQWLWVDDYPDTAALAESALQKLQLFLKGCSL